jgi:uncharacterized tellurite resistance protein B-like protein
MARVDEYLELVDDPRRTSLHPGNPADGALHALLAHVAFADGAVTDHELEFLQRVLPGRDPIALRAWAVEAGARPLDLRAVARVLPSVEERWKGLRFAIRMAWKDGTVGREERDVLGRLVEALGLPEGALDRVLGELCGRGDAAIEPARIEDALSKLQWDSVDLAEGPLCDELARVAPPTAEGVVVIRLDGVEVLGLYREGLVGWFREGAAWLPWRDIVTFTRMPTLGAAVQLHTEDGRAWTLADFRLSGLGALLDRIYAGERKPASPRPRVERLRGE